MQQVPTTPLQHQTSPILIRQQTLIRTQVEAALRQTQARQQQRLRLLTQTRQQQRRPHPHQNQPQNQPQNLLLNPFQLPNQRRILHLNQLQNQHLNLSPNRNPTLRRQSSFVDNTLHECLREVH
jgi:hypothetical protein